MKIRFIAILSMLVFAAGCSQEDEILSKQQEEIVKYLKGTHSPRLISEADLGNSLDENPPYYTSFGQNVYRYIADVYDPDRRLRPIIYQSSIVTITFRAYVFDGKNITDDTMPYFSNDPALEERFIASGLTPGVWSFEPLTLVMGSTEIIKGLEIALLGCRERDWVEVYMTYEMAYGDKNFNVIPRESPIVYTLTVDRVE